MPNDLPRFPIKKLPKDFPIKDLTPLKRSKYDFDPSEPRSHSIFRFRYKLGTDHVSIHHWYCKLSYFPFHHCLLSMSNYSHHESAESPDSSRFGGPASPPLLDT